MQHRDGSGQASPTTAGQWLYRQGAILLGPVETGRLIELLRSGQIDASTPVAPHGSVLAFKPLSQVDELRIPLARAEALRRVELQSARLRRRERRKRWARNAMGALAALAGLAGLALLAIEQPWKGEWAWWSAGLSAVEAEILDGLPSVHLAKRRSEGEAEIAYPRDSLGKGSRPGAVPPRGKAAALPPGQVRPVPEGQDEPGGDGLQAVQQWDAEAINAVVRANKASLRRCLTQELERQSGQWQATIPIEFTIGNSGRVTRLWIDNPEFRDEGSELYRCMLGALQTWRFPSYEGEQANVSLAFRVQGR